MDIQPILQHQLVAHPVDSPALMLHCCSVRHWMHSSAARNSAQSSRALEATGLVPAPGLGHSSAVGTEPADVPAVVPALAGTRMPYQPVVTIQPAMLVQPGESTRIQSMGSAPSELMPMRLSVDMAVAPVEDIASSSRLPMGH